VRDDDLLRFVTCGPIVQEVLEGLQGLRENAASEVFREAFLATRNKTPIWHKDRDYTAISRYTSLRALAWRMA